MNHRALCQLPTSICDHCGDDVPNEIMSADRVGWCELCVSVAEQEAAEEAKREAAFDAATEARP
jgi:hypothetical protein